MSDVGAAYDEMRTALGEAAADFFPYTCTVRDATATGGVRSNTDLFTVVPCKVAPVFTKRYDIDAMRNKSAYTVEMPMYLNGVFNSTKATHRLIVGAVGLQPARTFQVHQVTQKVWTIEAICTIEG